MSRDVSAARVRWRALTVYQRFEHIILFIVTALMAVIIVSAVWNLTLRIVFGLVLAGGFDPTDQEVFQAVFGMIVTVIIALEFKRSLVVVAESRNSIVQVRTVVQLAMLAIVRKLIILDLKGTEAAELFGLAAAMLALGAVYWAVRDQDRKDRSDRPTPPRGPPSHPAHLFVSGNAFWRCLMAKYMFQASYTAAGRQPCGLRDRRGQRAHRGPHDARGDGRGVEENRRLPAARPLICHAHAISPRRTACRQNASCPSSTLGSCSAAPTR